MLLSSKVQHNQY